MSDTGFGFASLSLSLSLCLSLLSQVPSGLGETEEWCADQLVKRHGERWIGALTGGEKLWVLGCFWSSTNKTAVDRTEEKPGVL